MAVRLDPFRNIVGVGWAAGAEGAARLICEIGETPGSLRHAFYWEINSLTGVRLGSLLSGPGEFSVEPPPELDFSDNADPYMDFGSFGDSLQKPGSLIHVGEIFNALPPEPETVIMLGVTGTAWHFQGTPDTESVTYRLLIRVGADINGEGGVDFEASPAVISLPPPSGGNLSRSDRFSRTLTIGKTATPDVFTYNWG